MSRIYVFNGDADGLCALQQLRLTEAEPGRELLVTGVKRDIALLRRVRGAAGDHCTVLDISLDVNRAPLLTLLEAGVSVRYFDHHYAGALPEHPQLEAHIDLSPRVCTSLLVDRYLQGRARPWALVGVFGDSLVAEGHALAQASGLAPPAAERLNELGVAMNYNAYGETVADLHVAPLELADELRGYADPLEFCARSPTYRRLAEGFRGDMELARRLEPSRQVPGAIIFILPDAPWARRASGTLANDLSKAHPGSAVAIISPKTSGGLLVSVRVPRDSSVSAEVFCRRFPTGGGRRTAAGINHLPVEELSNFSAVVRGTVSRRLRGVMDSIFSRMGRVYRVLRRTFGRPVAPLFVAVVFGLLRTIVAIGMALDHLFFPRLRKVRANRPIVLVGNPRTGTTFLQRFLADEGFGSGMELFLMLYPSLVLQRLLKPFLPLLEKLSPARFHSTEAHQTSLTLGRDRRRRGAVPLPGRLLSVRILPVLRRRGPPALVRPPGSRHLGARSRLARRACGGAAWCCTGPSATSPSCSRSLFACPGSWNAFPRRRSCTWRATRSRSSPAR